MTDVYSPANVRLAAVLTKARQWQGISQRQMAVALRRPQSFVSRYEAGQRRLDAAEIIEICTLLQLDPGMVVSTVAQLVKNPKLEGTRALMIGEEFAYHLLRV